MVEPLNTKAWVLDPKALRAATEAVADSEGWNDEDWPITEQTAKAAVLAYLSASPSLPVVDGGVRDIWECTNQLAGYVGPDTEEHLAQFLLRESDAAAVLAQTITAQQQEIERLTKEHAASQAVIEVQRQKLATNAGWGAAAAAESRVLSLEEEVKRLREALRCHVTHNPPGSDTRMIGSGDCQCPACRAALSGEKP